MFFLMHVNINDLNVFIELWPNPDLVWALSVKPGLSMFISYTLTNLVKSYWLYIVNMFDIRNPSNRRHCDVR